METGDGLLTVRVEVVVDGRVIPPNRGQKDVHQVPVRRHLGRHAYY